MEILKYAGTTLGIILEKRDFRGKRDELWDDKVQDAVERKEMACIIKP